MHTADTTPSPTTAAEPDPFTEGPAITAPTLPPVVIECQRLQDENENLKAELARLRQTHTLAIGSDDPMTIARQAARIAALESELAAARVETLDVIESAARRSCLTAGKQTFRGVQECNITDSGAISADADNLRQLAKHGRFRIVREYGRMVVGYWPENDPELDQPVKETRSA